MNRIKGFIALVGAALILGSFGIWIRFLDRELGVFQQIILRNAIALGFGVVLIFALKKKFDIKNVSKKHLFLYTFAFPTSIVLFTLSILNTQVTTAIFGLYVASLVFSLVAGVLVFAEKITPQKIAALVLVFVALAVYNWPLSIEKLTSVGFVFALGAGFAEGLANGFRKYLGGKLDKTFLIAIQAIGALILGLILTTAAGELSLPVISASTWVVLFIFGALLIAMTYLTLVGFSNFDLNLGTIVISSELFFGSLFAAIFFSEIPTFTQILGGLLIVAAIAVSSLKLKKA